MAHELVSASGRPLPVVKLCTLFAREKAKMPHELCTIMNAPIDKDVDELQRVAAVLYPALVIPLILAPAGRLFDAHWRVLFSFPRSRKELGPSWKPVLSCSVSQYHWQASSWGILHGC